VVTVKPDTPIKDAVHLMKEKTIGCVPVILRNKEYSYLEEKVRLLEVREDSLLLKISFLIEYKKCLEYL
jgi:CBS domain-containing protein